MFNRKPATEKQIITETDLLDLVQTGNTAAVRRYFDASLTGQSIVKPGWVHLQAALARNNMPMMKLLVTWGARPDEDNLKTLNAADYTRLRLAGLPLTSFNEAAKQPEAKATPALSGGHPHREGIDQWYVSDDPNQSFIISVPLEWREVLFALKEQGAAPEAMIVGGALRDRHHGKAVNDVDIFLKSPFWPGQQQSILRKAFKAAGLKVHTQETVQTNFYEGTTRVEKKQFTQDGNFSQSVYRDAGLGVTSAWLAIAGPNHTKYNIIFVDSPAMSRLHNAARKNAATNKHIIDVINKVDIGLCQVAFSSYTLLGTPQYIADSKQRKLTLVNPGQATEQHVRKVVEKYSDFKPDEGLKKYLQNPPRRYLSY